MASVHEAMSDLYDIDMIDAQTMARFDAMCLTAPASHVEQLAEKSATDQAPTK